jgi:prephenate dehydrogenase
MPDKKVAIIGLGLMGGSLARALVERSQISDITAVDLNEASLRQALRDGCITRGFNRINRYVWSSDIIFICTPIRYTMEYVKQLAGNVGPQCIITDVGSTKGEIIDCINRMPSPPCFIGGHPMAGTEKTGYSAGFAHLFENAYYILTPSTSSTAAAMDVMAGLISAIGGIPLVMDACEHDLLTGGISHVPHIIASGLVNLVSGMDTSDGKMQMLAAGGFKDITRIASSSPEIWESIVLSNRHRISEILEKYLGILNSFKDSMMSGDSRKIYDFFYAARKYRDSLAPGKKSLIGPICEIVVDVVDKPGIIGDIATILGCNNINIKNINVSNSRESEQGCLRITLPDMESVKIAFDLLTDSGYKVYRSS